MKKVGLLLAILLLLGVVWGCFQPVLADASLQPPDGLEAKVVSGTGIDLSWNDRSDNETGFIIERSEAENGAFLPVLTVGPNVTVCSDTGLKLETTYWYRVKSYNENEVSDPSNVAVATTYSLPPASPTDLKATAVTISQINLSWKDRSDNEKGFKLERKTGEGDFQQIAIVGSNITTYADTGLSQGIAYTYRIRAYNDGGDSAYSGNAMAVTGGLPLAPRDLQAMASGAQIKLTWTDASANEAGFKIERKAGGGSFVQIAALKADSTSYTDTGLSAGVTYTYRVRAYNDVGDSAYSAEAAATIEVAPAAPFGLSAAVASKSQIKLTWTDNSNNETGFKIERMRAGGSFSQVGTVGKNTTTYTDSGLTANRTYYYRVRSYNSNGDSAYSNTVGVTTAIPAAPSELEAATVSSTSMRLTWKDNSNNEAGFKIERKRSGGSYKQIGTVGADTTTFTDSGLNSNTTYHYRVRAYNPLGNSSYCREVQAATIFVASPSNLVAETVSRSQINLTWQDNSGNESGFKIERKTGSGSFKQIATVGANVTSYTDKGLSNNTVYYYRVRAYNSAAHSAYSNETSAVTGDVPAAPSDLAAANVSRSQINLTWQDNSGNESGFRIERKKAGGSYVQIATVGANRQTYSDTGLASNTVYSYRIRAYNSVGNSPFSNEITISTGLPSKPTNLAATAVSRDRIMLTWADNANNEAGYQIERRTAGGRYGQIATLGPNTTVYTDTGLSAGTTYYYRIRAYNSAGNSAYSNEAVTATNAEVEKVIILNIGKTAFYVNNQRRQMDAAPIITEGRTFLPIRYVAETLGASLDWDASQQKTTITFQGKVIELWIGSNNARVDGQLELIDAGNLNVKPLLLPPGRTMLPLRFISESLGCQVDWDSSSQEVRVTYPAP